jgi:hypothetical protein
VGACFAGACARVGERFAVSKASGRTLPFLTVRRARVWDFAFPSSSSFAPALRSPCSSAFAALPPLAPPDRPRLCRSDVELDAVQCVPRAAASSRRGGSAPSAHRRRGVKGARQRVHAAPSQGVCSLICGLPRARLLCPRQAIHSWGPLRVLSVF